MLRKFFFFLNILALVVLLLSCMAVYIDPNTFWQLSFIGFAFPIVLIINVFFLLLWIVKRSKFVFIPLAAIVLSWNFILSVFTISFSDSKATAGFKVMTWNVKNFDLYNWNKNEETREKMMAVIEAEAPDVICMQEFYSNNQLFNNIAYIRDTLGYKYCYFPPALQLQKQPKSKLQKTLWRKGPLVQQWGVATFSKYPIVDSVHIDFDNALTNNCIYTDIQIDKEVLRLYNVHFQSIHLGYNDYAAIDELEENQQGTWRDIKGIMRKMKRAYTHRAQQVKMVRQSLDDYKGHKMVCGDFNDVPVSYAYNTVRADMDDAFVEKGRGFGATFVNRVSIFRIDHVFVSPEIKTITYKTVKEPLSDHYPVCATFSF